MEVSEKDAERDKLFAERFQQDGGDYFELKAKAEEALKSVNETIERVEAQKKAEIKALLVSLREERKRLHDGFLSKKKEVTKNAQDELYPFRNKRDTLTRVFNALSNIKRGTLALHTRSRKKYGKRKVKDNVEQSEQ